MAGFYLWVKKKGKTLRITKAHATRTPPLGKNLMGKKSEWTPDPTGKNLSVVD
jgi:hypothetical protein